MTTFGWRWRAFARRLRLGLHGAGGTPPADRLVLRDGTAVELAGPVYDRAPDAVWARLREERPVVWHPGVGHLLVSRYRDVQDVLKRPSCFSSAVNSAYDPFFLAKDPPRHTATRHLLHALFAPRSVAARAEWIRQAAERRLDRAGSAFEAHAQLAEPLAVDVISHLLGIGERDEADLARWYRCVSRTVRTGEPAAGTPDGAALRAFDRALEESRVFGGEDVSGPLSGARASVGRLLYLAGASTVAAGIGFSLWRLAQDAHAQAKLIASPDRLGPFVDEVFRLETPIVGVRRVTAVDAEIGGVPVAAGTPVLASIASANRDPRVFEAPDALRPGRPERSLAFGYGPHYCLGAALARLEVVTALQVVLARGPFELDERAGGAACTTDFIQRGLCHLHLRFR